MPKLADRIMDTGYTLQQELLLMALERQAQTGILMTNPRVTGFTSFAKAVRSFLNDDKAPKTCKKLYDYLVAKGYYIGIQEFKYSKKRLQLTNGIIFDRIIPY